MTSSSSATPRPYNSETRSRRARETRERIVRAGVALVRELGSWDWRPITFVAVAERAGVAQRTAYVHFPTQRQLHQAIMDQLEEDNQLFYSELHVDEIPDVTARLFRSLAQFRPVPIAPHNEVFVREDRARGLALQRAVADAAPDLDVAARTKAAAMLDVIWGQGTYARLTGVWHFDTDQAIDASSWALRLVIDAVRTGRI